MNSTMFCGHAADALATAEEAQAASVGQPLAFSVASGSSNSRSSRNAWLIPTVICLGVSFLSSRISRVLVCFLDVLGPDFWFSGKKNRVLS